MAKKKKKRRRSGHAGAAAAVLSILITLLLSAGAVYGVYLFASSRPAPASLRDAPSADAKQVSVYTAPEPVQAEAPAPAPAPELPADDAKEEYGFEEVISDEDGVFVAKIKGKRYVGYIAVVDDPLRLTLGKCPWFGEAAYGRRVDQMADDAGALLAVNGGGFSDVGGVGKGGMPTGNVIYEGKMLSGGLSPTVGMDGEGKLHVGEFNGNTCLQLGLRWAVSYGPTLIENGEVRPNLDNTSQEPRTAVGQRADGKIVIIALQGRQLQALGVTCRELAIIMLGYGCVDAGNLDGGASSDMYFRGKYLNVCNTSGGPRPIPTSVLVMPSRAGEEG